MNSDVADIVEGTILEGPYWQEPVRVLSTKARANRIEVHAIGVSSHQHSAKLISIEDFRKNVRISPPSERAAFDGNSVHFRLAAEAHRIRLAYQYDPHFAVSVSQIDPLPHQLDAVYSRLLTQPRIRLLIADDPGAGKTIMGAATDRIGTRTGIIIGFVLVCVTLVWLVIVRELWMLYLFAIIFAFGYATMIALMSPIIAELFGIRSVGILLGIVNFAATIGCAVGPVLAGWLFDISGSYQLAFFTCIAVSFIGLIITLFIRPIHR